MISLWNNFRLTKKAVKAVQRLLFYLHSTFQRCYLGNIQGNHGTVINTEVSIDVEGVTSLQNYSHFTSCHNNSPCLLCLLHHGRLSLCLLWPWHNWRGLYLFIRLRRAFHNNSYYVGEINSFEEWKGNGRSHSVCSP